MIKIAIALLVTLATLVPAAHGADEATVGGCPLFPASDPWRTDISAADVNALSDTYIASISSGGSFLHPDFGSNPSYGIPYVVVSPDTRKRRVRFTEFRDESDPGPYPIPLRTPREAGSDHHVIAVQSGTCKLYEMYHARARIRLKRWDAGSGAVFDLTNGTTRPEGWTSADAAGLPILPGLVRRDEIEAGAINHALRFTAPQTQRGYIFPARHFASSSSDPDLPPMGLRLRLKNDYSLTGFTGASLVILTALKKYGMILADNGSSWFISGTRDTNWNDDDLDQMKSVPGSAFEAVDTGGITTG